MTSGGSAWTVVAVAGAGTYLIRVTLLAVAHRFGAVPPRVAEALRMIPAAALAALTVPAVLRPDGGPVDLADARFVAAAVAGVVAWRTKSLLATTVVGLALATALPQAGGLF